MVRQVRRSELLEVMDPGDRISYGLDFSELLDTGETLVGATWTRSAEAIAAGVEIYAQSHDTTTAIVWLQVAAGQQANARWVYPGQAYRFTVVATTSAGVIRERAIWPTIRQRNN